MAQASPAANGVAVHIVGLGVCGDVLNGDDLETFRQRYRAHVTRRDIENIQRIASDALKPERKREQDKCNCCLCFVVILAVAFFFLVFSSSGDGRRLQSDCDPTYDYGCQTTTVYAPVGGVFVLMSVLARCCSSSAAGQSAPTRAAVLEGLQSHLPAMYSVNAFKLTTPRDGCCSPPKDDFFFKFAVSLPA